MCCRRHQLPSCRSGPRGQRGRQPRTKRPDEKSRRDLEEGDELLRARDAPILPEVKPLVDRYDHRNNARIRCEHGGQRYTSNTPTGDQQGVEDDVGQGGHDDADHRGASVFDPQASPDDDVLTQNRRKRQRANVKVLAGWFETCELRRHAEAERENLVLESEHDDVQCSASECRKEKAVLQRLSCCLVRSIRVRYDGSGTRAEETDSASQEVEESTVG
mmetsp:Transcript_36223/g.113096  ORF Transcript_36223/g.113096 Transcript_36223/m.113096 type:complete len:218 (-) Transcript_36223:383-1036(-)